MTATASGRIREVLEVLRRTAEPRTAAAGRALGGERRRRTATATVRRGGARARAAALTLPTAVCLAVLAGTTTGCAAPPVSGPTVVETGGIERIAAAKRAGPVTLAGTLLDGAPWDLADQAGKVVVVNVWYSTCGPCEAEMPLLERTWKQMQARHPDVRFMGIDFGESPANGRSALARYGTTYPSLSDESRTLTLGLQGKANATPTTLVLDRQGRIAARVAGAVTSESTLVGLIEDVVKEA